MDSHSFHWPSGKRVQVCDSGKLETGNEKQGIEYTFNVFKCNTDKKYINSLSRFSFLGSIKPSGDSQGTFYGNNIGSLSEE